jgi:hypothetical protein
MQTIKLKLTIEGIYEYTKKDAIEDYYPKKIPGKEKLIKDELEYWKENITIHLPELTELRVELKEVTDEGE